MNLHQLGFTWREHCIHELIKARSLDDPTGHICDLLRSGHLKIPVADYTIADDEVTRSYVVSICRCELINELFLQKSSGLIVRLLHHEVPEFTEHNDATLGIAWTILVRHMRQSLSSSFDEKLFEFLLECLCQEETAIVSPASQDHNSIYQPLPKDNASFRLITLLPAPSLKETVRCRLSHSSLLDKPKYEAISYVWGSQENKCKVLIDNHDFSITQNLHEVLLTLRDLSVPKVIWVDAICIDQSNLEERASQVKLMGKLFRLSERVVAWLGLGFPGAKDIFALFDEPIHKTDLRREFQNKELDSQHPWRVLNDALGKVFKQHFFTRAWTFQEIVLPENVIIQCGTNSCSIESLRVALADLSSTWADFTLLPRKACSLERPRDLQASADETADESSQVRAGPTPMLRMRELVGRGLSSSRIAKSTIREVRNPVVAILQAARTRESGVPRDKIFSMLEIYRICAGTELPLVEPDYYRSCEAIMIEAAENIILHQNNLDILSCAADHRHRRDRILPSWVPDWREQLCPEMHFNGYSLGSAIAKTEHTFCKIRYDHRLLESWGYILDKIDRAIRIDISDREAFANSVLASAKMVGDPSAHDNHGTKAFWLSILFFLDARMFDIYQWSFGGQCDPTEAPGEDALPDGDVRKLEFLSAPKFPPRSRDAAVELTDVLWKYFYSESFPQWIYDGSNIFLTRMGSCVVAPKTAKSGDEIVLFPNTAYMFTLRRIFEYHHVTGPCRYTDPDEIDIIRERYSFLPRTEFLIA